jgi:hypothetical protein
MDGAECRLATFHFKNSNIFSFSFKKKGIQASSPPGERAMQNASIPFIVKG